LLSGNMRRTPAQKDGGPHSTRRSQTEGEKSSRRRRGPSNNPPTTGRGLLSSRGEHRERDGAQVPIIVQNAQALGGGIHRHGQESHLPRTEKLEHRGKEIRSMTKNSMTKEGGQEVNQKTSISNTDDRKGKTTPDTEISFHSNHERGEEK